MTANIEKHPFFNPASRYRAMRAERTPGTGVYEYLYWLIQLREIDEEEARKVEPPRRSDGRFDDDAARTNDAVSSLASQNEARTADRGAQFANAARSNHLAPSDVSCRVWRLARDGVAEQTTEVVLAKAEISTPFSPGDEARFIVRLRLDRIWKGYRCRLLVLDYEVERYLLETFIDGEPSRFEELLQAAVIDENVELAREWASLPDLDGEVDGFGNCAFEVAVPVNSPTRLADHAKLMLVIDGSPKHD